jgi:leucokinin receptor
VSAEDNSTHSSQPMNMTKPFCQIVNLDEEQLLIYRYTLVIVQYIIPVCVISFVYIQVNLMNEMNEDYCEPRAITIDFSLFLHVKMAVKLWGSKTPGNAQDLRDITLLKNKKKVIKMLVIVVVSFCVAWFPLQTYNIVNVTLPEVNEYRHIHIIWFCCDWLAMSNSCYNPFIYGIYNVSRFCQIHFPRAFRHSH